MHHHHLVLYHNIVHYRWTWDKHMVRAYRWWWMDFHTESQCIYVETWWMGFICYRWKHGIMAEKCFPVSEGQMPILSVWRKLNGNWPTWCSWYALPEMSQICELSCNWFSVDLSHIEKYTGSFTQSLIPIQYWVEAPSLRRCC